MKMNRRNTRRKINLDVVIASEDTSIRQSAIGLNQSVATSAG